MSELDISKFDQLKSEYSEKYVEMLKKLSIQLQMSYEDIYMKLPSSDIVKKDEEFISTTPVTRVLLGLASPASYVLTYFSILGKIPDDYPEIPSYFISKSEGSIIAPFTKIEFIESTREQDESKTLTRKK